MNIVILGLSITSSWGNGHATTYRGLVRELVKRGHDVLFLERDRPWYAENRDLPRPPYGETKLYGSLGELQSRFTRVVAGADLVLVGSYVPEGICVGDWVQATSRRAAAFYDIDTPVTLAALQKGTCDYLLPRQIPGYQVYLSFTGGPTLHRLEAAWGSPCARAFYCSVDPTEYYPEPAEKRWSIGYLGTYSADRQPKLEKLLLHVARELPGERFVVAGPLYPADISWPENVDRIEHLPPSEHRAFFSAQRLTLNITRDDMVAAGYSPSVRLFEAAACATAIISDEWNGLEEVLQPGRDVFTARDGADVKRYLAMPEEKLRSIGAAARTRVLEKHTAEHRASELENIVRWLRTAHSCSVLNLAM